MRQSYESDLVEIARENLREGRIDRRAFLKCLAAIGVGSASLTSAARASGEELVVATFSADSNKYMGKAWGEPFSRDTGINVIMDAVTPMEGKIIAMVESGHVVWDLCDSDGYAAISLGKGGYLEPIDYGVVDKSMVRDGWAWEYGIANHVYSHVLAYDTTKVDRPPTSWADFFDLKMFPGKRTLWRYMIGAPESALLADGVLRDALYPLDMPRAISKVRSILDDTVFWNSGSESSQLFLDGEVVMGNIWHSRARRLHEQTDGRIAFIWTDGLYCPSSWVVPKGGKNNKRVQQFIASTLNPERQLALLEGLYNGPTNPAASLLTPPALQPFDPSYEPNFRQQITRNEQWYADNYNTQLNTWLDGIGS
jgi:putative spermidine/putrescine transport system substrate-binding protein